MKKWVDENEELQIEVLNAMQVSMDWLKHPPGMSKRTVYAPLLPGTSIILYFAKVKCVHSF